MLFYRTRKILFLFFLVLFSCQKWDLDQTDFPQISWKELTINSLSSITLNATTEGLVGGSLEEHGFLYSTLDEEPGVSKINSIKINLGTSVSNETFSFELSDLAINTRYYLRGYAIYNSTLYYTEIQTYDNQSSIQVLTETSTIIAGENTGIISGSIRQLTPGLVVERYGHCWSTQEEEPTILGTSTNLGAATQDTSGFTITLTDMEPLLPYYVRAYAVVDGVAIYGEVVSIVKKDAWKQANDFPVTDVLSPPQTFFVNDQAHAIIIRNGEDKHEHFVYEAESDQWSNLGFLSGTVRWAQRACSAGGKGYFGLGEGYFTGERLNDLWEYDPDDGLWCEKQAFPGVLRIYAAFFGIGTKVYYGNGHINGADNINDFWEFDPDDMSNGVNACGKPLGKWTPIQAVPGLARQNASYFVLGEKAYLAGGIIFDPGQPADFWEFDPNATNQWVNKPTFNSIERFDSPAFVINGKGYYGLGSEFSLDWYEYNPLDTINGYDVNNQPMGSWRRLNNFPGLPRYQATGGVINGVGYILFGFNFMEGFLPQVWTYKPDQF